MVDRLDDESTTARADRHHVPFLEMLQLRNYGLGSLDLAVEHFVAVPACAAETHLDEVRPDPCNRRLDRDATRLDGVRLGDEIVTGKRKFDLRWIDAPGPKARTNNDDVGRYERNDGRNGGQNESTNGTHVSPPRLGCQAHVEAKRADRHQPIWMNRRSHAAPDRRATSCRRALRNRHCRCCATRHNVVKAAGCTRLRRRPSSARGRATPP